jgi:hypothetical protein
MQYLVKSYKSSVLLLKEKDNKKQVLTSILSLAFSDNELRLSLCLNIPGKLEYAK